MITLAQRMVNVMKEVSSVFKGANIQMGGGRSYTAVSHDDVARLLHTPLANNGIYTKVSIEKVDVSYRESINKFGDLKPEYRADVSVEVSFINADAPEDREVCKGFAFAFDSGDKAVGKAESMAVKYILLKNFVLESTDDEESRDNELSAKSPPKKDIVKEVAAKAAPAKEPVKAAPAAATVPVTSNMKAENTTARTVSFRRSASPATPNKETVKQTPAPAQSQDAEIDM